MYSKTIKKVLTEKYPQLVISRKAVKYISDILDQLYSCIMKRTNRIAKKEVSAREIQKVVDRIFGDGDFKRLAVTSGVRVATIYAVERERKK